MNRTRRCLLAAVVLALTPSAASAKSSKSATVQGYQLVTSASPVSGPTQLYEGIACPSGKTAVGAGISGADQDETIAGLYPENSYWAELYNITDTGGTITSYVLCAKAVPGYYLAYGPASQVSNGGGYSAQVACPPGTVALGGGGGSASNTSAVNLNSLYPNADGSGFQIKMNNGSSSAVTVQASTGCGPKPAGYVVVTGTASAITAHTQSSASAACPAGTHVLAGGARTASTSGSVNLNASYPLGTTGWRAYENNFSAANDSLTAYALCAKTKA